jgi:hypothetical protein
MFLILSGIGAALSSSPLYTLLRVVSSFLVLRYTIQLLPQSTKFRSVLWMFGLIPAVTLLAKEAMILQTSASYSSYSNAGIEHPIEHLAREAESRFTRMLETQSKTCDEARKKYTQRYSMPPPPGFDNWFMFATNHESPIIDNFDVIHQTLKPFFKLSGNELAGLTQRSWTTPWNDIWHCSLSSNTSTSQCNHLHRTDDRHISQSLDRLLSYEEVRIPPVNLLVNHLDEPAVLLPPNFNRTQSTTWIHYSHQPVWDRITQNCEHPVVRSPSSAQGNRSSPMSFIQDVLSSNDICHHPEYEGEHAFFVSPNKFWSIEAPVPILSTGTFSTMGDILFPSPAYTESEFLYDESADMDWEQKSNNLHWAGSTTGGYAANNNWRNFQRQRLATLAQDLETTSHQYLRVKAGVIKSINSTFINTRLYDISLTRLNQCSKKSCRNQNAFFHKSPWIDRNQAFKSRLVMDLDGNGISGRFYKFLASKSCPLKQTLLREWHDDRLVPWVHYVPVSMGMKELPELVSYLTLSENGRKRAAEIADRGRDWYGRALREVDMDIYLYRLILEMARIQDPGREAGKL